MHEISWQKLAACKDLDVDIFFPLYYQGQPKSKKDKLDADAKAVCAGCLVRLECLDYALKCSPDGIWGGMNEPERRSYKRKKRFYWQANTPECDTHNK